jgi:hypothetical protein
MAFLGECAEFDKQYAIEYVNATEEYFQEMTPILNRIDLIFNGEAKKTGKDRGYVARQFFIPLNDQAKTDVKKYKAENPAAFTMTCRTLPRLIREHELTFRPLREPFPDKMKSIDEWKE